MDTVKIGKFLKELRKENGFTQEQLGEKIGVTNKTVSRWENGNYIPPVECLAMLSDIYGISINEIISGQKLTSDEFVDAAEDNLKDALELPKQLSKKSERTLTIMWGASTLLTMLILFLLPTKELNFGYSLLLIFLVGALGFISNTINFITLLLNKERFDNDK
ncbi:MAG: helix-turn-helix transcriptional regulator [Lachnospiraceae bacterium]|nr:helix-turn-helix transcriptional regulator [Lachnospiraceae bacterium]